MKSNIHPILLLFLLLIAVCNSSCFKSIMRLKHVGVNQIYVVYDTSALRIPGNSFRIGIGVVAQNKDSLAGTDTMLFTNGLLNGSLLWSNFNIKVFGATYSRGKIYIPEQNWPDRGNIGIDVEVKKEPQKRAYISVPKNYITGTRLFAQNQFHKAPGNSIKLGVVNTYDNAATLVLTKRNEVDKFMANFNLNEISGRYSNGYFNITDDIFAISRHEAGLMMQSAYDPLITDSLVYQLDYIDDYKAVYYGLSGYTGRDGSNGYDGTSGSEGCDGYNGQPGELGYDGEDGNLGHDIAVDFEAYYDSILNTDLCMVTVDDLNTESRSYYLVNPKGGSVSIVSYGGDGGKGGDGGRGGNGGNGGHGEVHVIERKKTITETDSTGTHTYEEVERIEVTGPGGNGGSGGNGGPGGYGGNGGDGGNIYVYYSDASYPYLNCLIVRSIGGMGGNGGSGGLAGCGGAAGSGSPSGGSGSSGWNGTSGWNGKPGFGGKILFTPKTNP
jgi:hypothetical protein